MPATRKRTWASQQTRPFHIVPAVAPVPGIRERGHKFLRRTKPRCSLVPMGMRSGWCLLEAVITRKFTGAWIGTIWIWY